MKGAGKTFGRLDTGVTEAGDNPGAGKGLLGAPQTGGGMAGRWTQLGKDGAGDGIEMSGKGKGKNYDHVPYGKGGGQGGKGGDPSEEAPLMNQGVY